jgi:predicted exporter
MRRLGFDASAISTRQEAFAVARDQMLTPSLWLASPLSAPVRHLWLGELGKSHAAVVLLDRTEAPEAVRVAVERVPGVVYVDQVADISSVLGDYRRIAGWLMIVVLAVMIACLLVFYRSRVAILTAIPATAGPRIHAGGPWAYARTRQLVPRAVAAAGARAWESITRSSCARAERFRRCSPCSCR